MSACIVLPDSPLPRGFFLSDVVLCAVIEKYTRNTRFCLICNYVNKIIPALQSRCTRFRFPPLADSYVRSRLQFVIDSEEYVQPIWYHSAILL